jgi:starch synthase
MMGVGLAHADMLNAVSQGYAREILTPVYGFGLEGVLRARRARLHGILNGIDLEQWDPHIDRNLKARFDTATLDRRGRNKRALQRQVGLPVRDDLPLLGVVSRLDAQKGFDIAAPALRHILSGPEPVQLVLLGTGLAPLEAEFRAIGEAHPAAASINLRFDSALASRIYAGADMLLIPSRYEPCGLTQMIAMRYGAVPVVRRTGGLADTVADYKAPGRGTGFVFRGYNVRAFERAIRRALAVYHQSGRWRALQVRGMRRSLQFDWTSSARAYLQLYHNALTLRRGKE